LRVTAQTLDGPLVLGALVFEAFETLGEVANEAFDVIGVVTAYRTTKIGNASHQGSLPQTFSRIGKKGSRALP